MQESAGTPPEPEPRNARLVWGRPGVAAIEIDGVDLSESITGARLVLSPGRFPRLVLSLDIFAGEAAGPARIELQSKDVVSLLALGWTPPAPVVVKADV